MSVKPAFSFITSLRHPATVRDYALVEQLYCQSLRSLNNQTAHEFQAVVVSNVPFAAPTNLRFPVTNVTVDFPVPHDADKSGASQHDGNRVDKGAKLAVAISQVDSGFVMPLDADDYVSRDLVSFASQRAGQPGWFVAEGIRYDAESGLYKRQLDFNGTCGTSLVFDRSLFPTQDLSGLRELDAVLSRFEGDRVALELGSHHYARSAYGLEPLPFSGAAYVVNTGENATRQSRVRFGRPIGVAVAAQYGIDRPSPRSMWRFALTRGAKDLVGAFVKVLHSTR